ncbi:MAG TPA: class II aldolase/adducin family protein [Acidimicrobiales bacterium]|jgi:ribulose-5-phosphate 4-epimerase/fuculose-1-phosphate aldolase|nr:class II aldolase/adducin family protein [Acidimicrobiales bacterium]
MTTTASMANAAVQFPQPPSFSSLDGERHHRKKRLAAAFRLFAKFGYEEGVAGHITARDPELTDHFWVNPLAVPFSMIRVSDLELVDSNGTVVEGDQPVNPAAFAIHSAIHAARPDVVSAAHAHAVHGKAWSTLHRLLDPITQDACSFYRAHSLYDTYGGIVFGSEEAKRIAGALGSTNKAVILANHGFVTVGSSVDEAAYHFINAEHSAHAQLMAEAVGTPKLIDQDVAAGLGGDAYLGWLNFQPYWSQITHEQPDLLG